MEHVTDQDLVAEIRAGSRVAFVELMRRYERSVFRIGFSYTRDREEALDVVQDVFLKVHARLDTYRSTGAFGAWVHRIAHRTGLNWVRDHRALRGREVLDALNAPALDPTQETALVEQERRQRIRSELDHLNPKQRQAVVLRYYERMPIREIASALECSEGVAKNILFRSLRKMRDAMTAHPEEERP
jgi:RNA polymerase sigma-70 factor (ECF subfamily)